MPWCWRLWSSSRCSTSVSAWGRGAARHSRCRCCRRRWRSSPTWRRSSPPASPMPAASLRAAVGFLTRVPVGRVEGADVARAAAAAGVALLVHPPLSPAVAAALAVAVGTVLTGALHLDALADTADAVGSSTRERALEIMRDSRIGSFGAAALRLDLLLRVTVLAQLLGGSLLGPLIAAGALSRGASVALAAALPYAREGDGVLDRRGSSL